jgi:hypothetical protein
MMYCLRQQRERISPKKNIKKCMLVLLLTLMGFWAEQAREFVTWFKEWDQVQNWNYHEGKIRWFEGAKLNVSYNCLDRHLETRADQVAIIWKEMIQELMKKSPIGNCMKKCVVLLTS